MDSGHWVQSRPEMGEARRTGQFGVETETGVEARGGPWSLIPILHPTLVPVGITLLSHHIVIGMLIITPYRLKKTANNLL